MYTFLLVLHVLQIQKRKKSAAIAAAAFKIRTNIFPRQKK
jgi:hypothetical protein